MHFIVLFDSMETTSSGVFSAVISAPLGVSSGVGITVRMRVLHFMVCLTALERACDIMAWERLPLSTEDHVIV